MKLDKRGWSLQEMLVLMGLLFLALLVSAFYVMRLYSSFDKGLSGPAKTYEDVENIIEERAKQYIRDYYKEEIGNGTITIKVDSLIEKGIMTQKDATPTKSKSACNGYVLVKRDYNEILNYDGYIFCDGYQTEGYQEWRLG